MTTSIERPEGISSENGNGRGPAHVRVAIIGAGFSGLGMAARLRRAGIEDFVVLDRAEGIGGTWWLNTYPGCQCDVASHLYSFSFAPNPSWSRTFSRQPEIRDYLEGVAQSEGIVPHLRLGVDVTSAGWDETSASWRLETSQGPLLADLLVAGIGPLSEPSVPDVPGLDSFEGTVFHSARWNHEHDLSGERVASIGTGASAIQYVPRIQPHVGRLHVFQRTPPWIMPHTDRPTRRVERWALRNLPGLQKLARRAIYWSREWMVIGMAKQRLLMRPMRWLGRAHIRRHVGDPELRRKVTPSFEVGCKRILISNTWYPALGEDNVELVTDAITEVRPHSIVTADGSEREVDTIILGTGFKVTDFGGAEMIRGRGGTSLSDLFQGSPQGYLGSAFPGFPNMFMLLGPNTGLGHNSVVYMIEAQIGHVFRAISELDRQGAGSIEVRREAHDSWNAEIQAKMPGSVWTDGGCSSWYIDRNGLNTTIWPDFTFRFRRRARDFDPGAYRFEAAPTMAEPGAATVGPRS
jgi:cation diffusion facilitator CzcD-associated flavoprotein CzcO